jgi:hypothetical protein
VVIVSTLVLLALAGCTITRNPSPWVEQRTAIEQLLFSQALERSLGQMALPLPPAAPLTIVEANAPSPPIYVNMLREAVTNRLGALGFHVRKDEKEAAYLVRVIAQTLGTEQGVKQFGLPSMQSALLPVGTPEISLYKEDHLYSAVRLSLTVFDAKSGRQVLSTPWHGATTYFNQYTALIVIGFRLTNVDIPVPFLPPIQQEPY